MEFDYFFQDLDVREAEDLFHADEVQVFDEWALVAFVDLDQPGEYLDDEFVEEFFVLFKHLNLFFNILIFKNPDPNNR